jgi:DNA-binding transcriptional MerR regulator
MYRRVVEATRGGEVTAAEDAPGAEEAAAEGAGHSRTARAAIRRMTIEELAERAGMTVRNVREHQTRGLLPPPALVGRKGFYDERHLARLLLVRQLQEEGLNLHAVGWLLEQAPPEAAEVARLKQALFAPWATERPRTYTLAELVTRFGVEAGAGARTRAEELGLLERVDEVTWVSPAPRLLEAGAQLVQLGVEVEAALDVVEQLTASLAAVARSFVELFVAEILSPTTAGGPGAPLAAGDRAEDVDRPGGLGEPPIAIGEAVERLRPIASEAVLAAFQLRMDELVARTFGPGGWLEGGGQG